MIHVVVLLILRTEKSTAMAETYMKYKDQNQAIEVRVEDLLSRMSLDEKIGQMTQIDISVASYDVMKTYLIGNFYIFVIAFSMYRPNLVGKVL